jgi:predicted nucleic acid-binding protein
MKYVLDSSVALKWVLPERDTGKAIALRDDYRNNVHTLVAPSTFPVEIAHALTRAERKGILKPPEATQRLIDLLSTLPQLYPYLTLLPRAVEISSQARIGVYDCLYIALSEQEQCEFVTADQRLAAIGFGHVRLLASLP